MGFDQPGKKLRGSNVKTDKWTPPETFTNVELSRGTRLATTGPSGADLDDASVSRIVDWALDRIMPS